MFGQQQNTNPLGGQQGFFGQQGQMGNPQGGSNPMSSLGGTLTFGTLGQGQSGFTSTGQIGQTGGLGGGLSGQTTSSFGQQSATTTIPFGQQGQQQQQSAQPNFLSGKGSTNVQSGMTAPQSTQSKLGGFPTPSFTTSTPGFTSNLGNQTQSTSFTTQPQPQQTFGQPTIAPTTMQSSSLQSGLNMPNSLGLNILGLPSYTSNFQPQITNQGKKELDKNEIITVFQNFIWAKDPMSPFNLYKHMVYNRIPAGNEQIITAFQNYVEKSQAEDGTQYLNDYNLWVKALQNNPDPTRFYPTQVSSPNHLVNRMKTTETFEYSATETVISLENTLNEINSRYDNEIEGSASLIKKKIQLIKSKYLNVVIKTERLANLLGKVEKNYQFENQIINDINNKKNFINENLEYKPKVEQLISTISSMGLESTAPNDYDFFKDFDSNRFEKNITILADMKKILEVTLSDLKQGTSLVNFMQGDLEKLKKYGKI
jgi:hypothetical protein